MLEILIHTLKDKFSSTVINTDPVQLIIYFLINFLLAFISYKIFNLIGERYTKPKKSTKKLMNFFIFSTLYFFASGLFELLTIFYSIYLVSKVGLFFQFVVISLTLFTFYFFSRYYLILAIITKFSKSKSSEIRKLVVNLVKVGIVLDLVLFFYLWYNYDYVVLVYNLVILVSIFMWIIRHKLESHKKLYMIYFFLLILIFNRLNFMFIQFSYSDVYYIFDIVVSAILIGIYLIVFNLIKRNGNILER